MKIPLRLVAVCLALAGAASGFGQQPTPPPPVPPPPPPPPQTLHVLIAAPLGGGGVGQSLYERVASDYGLVFRHRKWPMKISLEEWGGGKVHDRAELEVFVQRIRSWLPGELTYAAWTTLRIDGRKYDLGIIQYVYDVRAYEPADEMLDDVVQGAARETADKIEPLLFPRAK